MQKSNSVRITYISHNTLIYQLLYYSYFIRNRSYRYIKLFFKLEIYFTVTLNIYFKLVISNVQVEHFADKYAFYRLVNVQKKNSHKLHAYVHVYLIISQLQ